MNIQNNSNLNFEANKVLLAQKTGKKTVSKFAEVLKLDGNDSQDIEFVISARRELNKRNNLTSGQKNLDKFLGSFLDDIKEHASDFFLAIKNGKTIEGGFRIFPDSGNYVILEDAFTTKQNEFIKDTMYKALINETKKHTTRNLIKHIYGVKENSKTLVKGYSRLMADDFNKKSREISCKNRGVSFNKLDEDVNIMDLLG